MKAPKAILLGCLLCVAVFGGGVWFGLQLGDADRRGAHEDEAVAKKRRSEASTDGFGVRPSPEIVDEEPPRRKPLPEYLSDLLALEEEIDRSYHFVQLLESLEPSEFPRLHDELRALPAGPRQIRMLEKFYRRWGEIDPIAAGENALALQEGHRGRYIAEVAIGWAKQEPVQAWNWIMEVSNDGGIHVFRPDLVMAEIARRDVATAFTLADSLGEGVLKDFVSRRMARELSESGEYQAGFSEILSRDPTPSHLMLLNQTFRSWGRDDLASAQAALQSVPEGRYRDSALLGFMGGWAAIDPAAAMQYVLNEVEGENRGRLLQTVAGAWVRSGNLNEVAELLDRLPATSETDSGVAEIVSSIAMVDPAAAITWIDTIDNEEKRAHLRTRSVRVWTGKDPQAAEGYVDQLQPGNDKNRALQGLAWGYFHQSEIADGAFQAIDRMTDSGIQQETLLHLAEISSHTWSGNVTVDKGRIREQVAAMQNVPDAVKEKALSLLE